MYNFPSTCICIQCYCVQLNALICIALAKLKLFSCKCTVNFIFWEGLIILFVTSRHLQKFHFVCKPFNNLLCIFVLCAVVASLRVRTYLMSSAHSDTCRSFVGIVTVTCDRKAVDFRSVCMFSNFPCVHMCTTLRSRSIGRGTCVVLHLVS